MLVLSPVEVFKIQTEEEKWEMENGEGKGESGEWRTERGGWKGEGEQGSRGAGVIQSHEELDVYQKVC